MLKVVTPIAFLFLMASLSASAQLPGAAIDVLHYTFALQLNDHNDMIKGRAEIELRFIKNVSSLSIDLVKKNNSGKGMLVSAVEEGGKNVKFLQDSDRLIIYKRAAANGKHKFTITYQGIPADGLIISENKFEHRTFFGDNWPNRAHNWLPCVDHPADKASVDFLVTAPNHYRIVANGLLVSEKRLPSHAKLWHWKETAALPTKVMVIGAADFAVDRSGEIKTIPVYSYVFPEDADTGFSSYRVAPSILAYYIAKLGPYAYKKLANVQSKTKFGGMENASAIFYFENSVNFKGVEELMAHEIAHQWFGDAATEKDWRHLWLSEGFATFMTNIYLEAKYGADSLKARLTSQREKVIKFEKSRFTPVVDTAVKNNYIQLLNANSYEKGGWILHMLRRKLGEEAFWQGIRNYYAKYDGGNADSEDLRRELEQASNQNLESFFKQWLYTAGTPNLTISWTYDDDKKLIKLHIEQTQDILFDFPLEIGIDESDTVHSVAIRNKVTDVVWGISKKPKTILVDPNVNLLAQYKLFEK